MQEAWVQPLVQALRSHMGKKKEALPPVPTDRGLGAEEKAWWVGSD